MKQVVKKVLPMVALLVLVGAGCSNMKPDNTSSQSTSQTQTQTTDNKMAATDCKTDTACADSVWSECKAGTFVFAQGGTNIADVTVTGKENGGCRLTWDYTDEYLAQAGAAGQAFSGKSMSCLVASTGSSAAVFGEFMDAQIEVDFKDCSGSLKDILMQPPMGEATLRD